MMGHQEIPMRDVPSAKNPQSLHQILSLTPPSRSAPADVDASVSSIPARHRRVGRRTWALVAGAGVVTLAVLAGQGARGGSSAGGPKADQWEYGILVVEEKTATIRAGNRTTWLQVTPPVAGDPATFRNGDIFYKEQFNPLVTALNTFGAMGWELPPCTDIKAGQALLVRRLR